MDFSKKKLKDTGYTRPTHLKSKLTEEQVYEIRRLSVEGQTIEEIAEKFGVSVSVVGSIRRREAWEHLPWDNYEEDKKKFKRKSRK